MNLADSYTTLVVGAGPAGIMAAIHAAPAGPVLLVDAMDFPRDKSCGGMLNEYSQDFLARRVNFGAVPREVICEPEWVNFRFYDWDKTVLQPTQLRFMNVNRMGFDEWLLHFLPENVEVAWGTKLVNIVEKAGRVEAELQDAHEKAAPKRTVTAKFAVGADGPRSKVRRCLPVSQLALYKTLQDFVKLTGEMEPYFDCLYTRTLGNTYGYGYTIPKDDICIVGSVFYPGSTDNLATHKQAVATYRQHFAYGEELVKREAWTAVQVRSVKDIPGGVGHILLAGDAGGLMSPSSGEGISFALNSGKLAGEAITAAAQNGTDVLENYQTAIKSMKNNIAFRLLFFPVLNAPIGKWLAGVSPAPLANWVAHHI